MVGNYTLSVCETHSRGFFPALVRSEKSEIQKMMRGQLQFTLAVCVASWNTAFAGECLDLFHTLPEAPDVLKATRDTLGCDSMEVTCNGIPDNQICENALVGPSECGNILLNGMLDVSQLCPLMCKTCVDTTTTTTNTETSTTESSTTTTVTTATGTTTTTATTTTGTTTTGTDTSTTGTTTTTLVCNGIPDPETCTSHGALAEFCSEESNVGYAFRMDCPILCTTCIPTTTTSTPDTTPTTTPATEAPVVEALVYCGASSVDRANQCQNKAFVGELKLDGKASSCYCDDKCKMKGDCCPDFCGVCEGGRPVEGSSPLACEATTMPPDGSTTTPLVIEDTGTCRNSCGGVGISTRTGLPARCTCSPLCKDFDDCCVDYDAKCVTTKGVTTTSTTSSSTTDTTTTETTKTQTSTTTTTVSCESCAVVFAANGGCPTFWESLADPEYNMSNFDAFLAPGCEESYSRCDELFLNPVCLSTTATTTTSATKTTTSATATTATNTTMTSTTPESCEYLLADLVFFFDSSRTVGLAKFIQQTMFACSVVEELEDSLAPSGDNAAGKGLRVASIIYSESADIQFDFHGGNGDAKSICESLQNIRYVPTDFTRLHTAFELMRRKLLVSTRGYRGPESGVPTKLVVFTHGKTLNTMDLATELRLNQFTAMTFVQTTGGTSDDSLFLGGTLASSPVSDSAVLSLSELDDSSTADSKAASSIASTIQFNAPCAVSCDVKADVLFIFDGSTSIEDASAGGASGNFNLLREFTAETIDRFRYQVANDDVRVGAISFANDAKVHFDLSTLVTQPDLIMYGIRQIAYDHSVGGSDELTDTNLHDALALVRTNIAAGADFGLRGGTVPLILVVLTDGKVRNEAGTAVKDLENELAQMSSDVRRIAYGIGSNQSPTILQMIAGFDGVVGSVAGESSAAHLASTIMTMGEQCKIRQTSTTSGVTAATTVGPKTDGRLVNKDTCMALHPAYSDGCNELIAAIGCNTEVAKLLCASSCSQCADHCHTRNPFRQNECLRCKDGLYLNSDTGMCVSSKLCPEGTIAVQTDDDSDYGRACVVPGGICDYGSTTAQCKPPNHLGGCEVAEVGDFPGEAECTACKMGSFLIGGRCMETFRCQGDEVEQDRSQRCNCNAFTAAGGDEPDKTCARCKIYVDSSFTDEHTDPIAAGLPAWLSTFLTYEHGYTTGWRQCMECRFGTIFDAVTQSCIAVSDCPAEMAVYNPKSTGGACEAPFTCDGTKSTTGEACKCPRRGSCNACNYVAGGGPPECFRCNEGKLLWRAGGNVCIAPKKCARKGGIGFVRDGVPECMPL